VKNLTRAQRKKAIHKFKIGDVVTWGWSHIAHRVVEVTHRGVVVDVTELLVEEGLQHWARQRADGRWVLLVLFDHNTKRAELGTTCGPPVICDREPDRHDRRFHTR
jgi:hypothetical protein